MWLSLDISPILSAISLIIPLVTPGKTPRSRDGVSSLFSLMKKIISDYRIEYEKAQKNNTIKQLENKAANKQIAKYFWEDFEPRKKILEEVPKLLKKSLK